MTETAKQFQKALLSLDTLAAKKIVAEASGRMAPMALIDEVIVSALNNIGESWTKGDAALSQVYMGGRICEEIIDGLLPPGDPQRKDQPLMAIAVLDDYHMLGKRVVLSFLRASGYELQDFGRVTVQELLKKTAEHRTRILLISSLMLHSALHIRDVVEGLKAARMDVTVVVGGAPFNFDPQLWRDVQADYCGRTAADARTIIQNIVGGAV